MQESIKLFFKYLILILTGLVAFRALAQAQNQNTLIEFQKPLLPDQFNNLYTDPRMCRTTAFIEQTYEEEFVQQLNEEEKSEICKRLKNDQQKLAKLDNTHCEKGWNIIDNINDVLYSEEPKYARVLVINNRKNSNIKSLEVRRYYPFYMRNYCLNNKEYCNDKEIKDLRIDMTFKDENARDNFLEHLHERTTAGCEEKWRSLACNPDSIGMLRDLWSSIRKEADFDDDNSVKLSEMFEKLIERERDAQYRDFRY